MGNKKPFPTLDYRNSGFRGESGAWQSVLPVARTSAKKHHKHDDHTYGAVTVANDPNFNTNAPPFRVRGCIAVIGGAFLLKGVQTM